MIGFYNYTVYLTYLGLASSVLGMALALKDHVIGAVICLLFSGVCDLFDGKLARTKKDRTEDEKNFGIQIDSLCDVICFGVFPALLGCCIGADRWWQIVIAVLFVNCGVIRLAYFNVTELRRQQSTDEKRSEYLGLPITSSALFVPLLIAFSAPLGNALPVAYSILLFMTGLCYILPIPVKKPGHIGAVLMIMIGILIAAALLFR